VILENNSGFHIQSNALLDPVVFMFSIMNCVIQIQESWTFVLFQSAASVSGKDDEELERVQKFEQGVSR
jgi:hypothetical protein